MKRILFADDEEALRILYKEEFQAPDIEVLLACNGQEALDVCERERPDLVVLDMRMPVVDGREALRRIKALRRDIPVIMFTSLAQQPEEEEPAWDDYILKSPDLEFLKAVVRRRLSVLP
jgi:CheY-like chemotaxis protein